MTQRRQIPTPDVFARTVPIVIERHAFGEHRKASLSAVETTADKTVLALTKKLVQMPETAAIRLLDTRFREWLNTVGMPFRDGVWLIPVGLVSEVDRKAREWEERRHELVLEAKRALPQAIEAMREPLGPLFNEMDYPTPERFEAKFWVDWRFVDFGVPAMLRQVEADVFDREMTKLREAGRRAESMIEQHLAGQLFEITEHVQNLLTPKANGRRPGLRDHALDPLFQYLDTIALRNVTNFQQLQQATERLRAISQGLTVEGLRDNDALRERTAQAMAEVKEFVGTLVTEDTRRAIRVRPEDEDGDNHAVA